MTSAKRNPDIARAIAAEALGTLFLVAAIVGSGIMAERATQDAALALLCNTAGTAAMLFVLIAGFAGISGAHFNPAVTCLAALDGAISKGRAAFYVAAQIAGGAMGACIANAMFGGAAFASGLTERGGVHLIISEAVATFGLGLTIYAFGKRSTESLAAAVALYIAAAYWFTPSTSFANPAVTIARALTPSFSGIQPGNVLPFVAAQLAGALAAWALARWLFRAQPANA